MSDEVLVHISTPATRQNDELFRSLANAYTEFEPHRIHRDKPVRKRAEANQRQPKISSTRARTSATGETANASILTASKESYGSFPSNLSADEHYLGQNVDPGIDESVRPISRLAQLDRSYLSWRKRATPKSSFKRSEGELQTSSDGPDADTGFIEDSQSALQALQSQLQDTYSTTSADTSEDEGSEDEILPNMGRQPSPAPSPDPVHHSRAAEELPLPAPSQNHAPVERRPETPGGPMDLTIHTTQNSQNNRIQMDPDESVSQKTTDLSIHATLAICDDSEVAQNQSDFSRLPMDAFPPPPIVSVARPGALPSQITKHLAAIKTRNPTRFRPLKVRRNLETDERGFWRIDCTRWPPNAQRDFWLSLSQHVCSGRVGWGTTLHRESDSEYRLGLVRLYCWGEIVEHMWLLLWLCSKGKISGLESKWIDANGVAVVEAD